MGVGLPHFTAKIGFEVPQQSPNLALLELKCYHKKLTLNVSLWLTKNLFKKWNDEDNLLWFEFPWYRGKNIRVLRASVLDRGP